MLRKAWSALARIPWWLWVIAAVALVPRLLLVPYGLPYEFDPDERLFVDAAWNMVEAGRGDPEWYAVPASTLLDIVAALYGLYAIGGMLVGTFDSVAAAGDAYRADVSHFFAIARVVTALSGVGVVLMTYAVVRELRVHVFWAATAAVLVAVSFPMIQFSTLVRPDMLMTMFLLATVIVSMRVLDRPSAKLFLVAGVFLGLAAASKYPGAMALVPIVAANTTLVVREKITPRRGLLWLGGAVLAAAVVALLVAPYLYVNPMETIRAVASEARSDQLGATGVGVFGDLWRYLTEALPWALAWPATIAGVGGLVVMLIGTRTRMASLTFWVYAVFISFLALWWLRWALPLVPFVAAGVAFLFAGADARLRRWRDGRWIWTARAVVALVLLVPILWTSIPVVADHATNNDVRIKAIDWLHETVPDGSTILLDSYTTQVSSDRYDVLTVKQGELVRWTEVSDKTHPDGYFATLAGEWFGTPAELIEAIQVEEVDYVVVSELWLEQFRNEAATYPIQLATYEAILDSFPVVARFDGSVAPIGWPLTIHRVQGETGLSGC